MIIKLNDKSMEVKEGTTLDDVVRYYNEHNERGQVGQASAWLNGKQVLSGALKTTYVQDGDEVTILKNLFGG